MKPDLLLTDKPDIPDSMIRGVVRVIAIDRGAVLVQPENQTACGACPSSPGCGTKTLSSYFNQRTRPLRLHNDFAAQVGDRLEVGIALATIIRISLVLYMLPLASMLMAAILADAGRGTDGVVLVAAVFGLAAGFYMARLLYASGLVIGRVDPIYLGTLPPSSSCKVERVDLPSRRYPANAQLIYNGGEQAGMRDA